MIDIIAKRDLLEILCHPKVAIVIKNLWRGPYERKVFISESSNFKIIYEILNPTQKFFGCKVSENNKICWVNRLKKNFCLKKKNVSKTEIKFEIE